ncbi:UDP-diphospho-muramoylpentapeptide beta-N-acetylglucosaminyltransferase, partial [Mycobacterium tuberculosis]
VGHRDAAGQVARAALAVATGAGARTTT